MGNTTLNALLKKLKTKSTGEALRFIWRQIWPERYAPHIEKSDARRQFERDGILILPNLIPQEEIAAANAEIDAALAAGENPKTGQPIFEKPAGVKNIPSILSLSPKFRELMRHPRLMPYLEATIGCRVKLFHPQALIYPPNHFFYQNWHSDVLNTIPGIDMGSSTLFVKAIFYLSDITRDSGAFTYLKGSQKTASKRSFSYLYDGLLRRHKITTVEAKAGSVVLFHTSGFHKVMPNISRTRRTLTYSYTHFWVRNNFENPVLNGFAPTELSDVEKHMVGYRLDEQHASFTQVCPAFSSNKKNLENSPYGV